MSPPGLIRTGNKKQSFLDTDHFGGHCMWNIFIGLNGVLLCLIGIKINCTGHVIAVGADAKQWQQ
jgi:hypothetical protein